MQKTGARLRALVEDLLPQLVNIPAVRANVRPAPGKWSPKEVIGHLIDSASNNQQKFIRTALATGGHFDYAGYQQDDWVAIQQYQERNWTDLVQLWANYNRHIAHVMAHLPESAAGNTISVNGGEAERLDYIVADYVAHLEHHIEQVGV